MKQKFYTLLFAIVASIGTLLGMDGGWSYWGDVYDERYNEKIGDFYYALCADGSNDPNRFVVLRPNESYKNFTSINIPSTVSYLDMTWDVRIIDHYAFSGCTNLRSVTLPIGVTQIGGNAFEDCIGLTEIELPVTLSNLYDFAFKGCVNLERVRFNKIVSIGMYAFKNCTSLIELELPENNPYALDIGENAFENVCNVILPESSQIQEISKAKFPWGAKAINGYVEGMFVYMTEEKTLLEACSSQAQGNIEIPNGVIRIGSRAFWGCDKVTNISIPNTTQWISNEAFYKCISLSQINISNSVTEIMHGAFGRSGLTSVSIPDNVTDLGDSIFASCDKLTSVKLPNNVKVIGNKFFYNCIGLKSFNIPASVQSIKSYAFAGSGLNEITIHENVTDVGEHSFENCTNLKSIRFLGKNKQMNVNTFYNCYNIKDVFWNIPSFEEFSFPYSKLDKITFGDSVLRVPNGICNGQSNLNKVEFLSDEISVIGANAFNGCTNLSYIQHFPDSLQKIKDNAFKGAPLLSITIPRNVDEIGKNAFDGCNPKIVYWNADGTNLDPKNMIFDNCIEQLYLGNEVKIIHPKLFKGQTKISELYIPSGQVGMQAFEGCTGLRKLSLGTEVTKINGSAFQQCTNISGDLILPNSLDTISSWTFENCTKITSVTIGKNIKKISGFEGCTGIKTVYNLSYMSLVPHAGGTDNPAYYADKVYNIKDIQGDYLFSGNALIGYIGNATNISLPTDYKGSTYRIGDQAFEGATQLLSVTIPEAVTEIGKSAFDGCTGLTSMNIPNSVTKIEEKAFNGCSNIATISLGANLSQLGANALSGCTSITEISCSAKTPPAANTNTFTNVPSTAKLSVPAGSQNAYKNAQGWNHFTNIPETNLIHVTGVNLKPTTMTIGKGKEAIIYATVMPSNASDKTVTWSSSDNTIATITNGLVYGKKGGKATITCTTTDGGYTASCEVTVATNPIPATGFEFYKSAYYNDGTSVVPYSKMNEGDTLTFVELATGFIDANVMPYSVSNGNIDFVNSDPYVVSAELTSHINFANSIKLTPLRPGTAKLTISTTDGTDISKSVYVTITPDPTVKVIGVRCLPQEISISKGEKDTIDALVLPFDATDATVYWKKTSGGNPLLINIKTLEDNRCEITAKSVGTAYIYVETYDGQYKDTCKINIIDKVPVTGLSLNQTEKTLKVGETLQLTPIFTPSNATNQKVYWSMDNDTVATIENGLVTAIHEGTVVVTCTSDDGDFTATCTITVQEGQQPPVTNAITVRLKGSSASAWSKVNLYYWADGMDSPAWPGTTLTKDAQGWYGYSFPTSVTSVNIIWNDGNNQTVDITNVTESTCYKLNSTSGKSITVSTINCEEDIVSVTGVSLNKKTLQIEKGGNNTLTATVLPANATNKAVTWTSSNTTVASVSNSGKITAKKAGVSTISCETVDGHFKAECYIVVTDASQGCDYSFEPTTATTIQFEATDLSFSAFNGGTFVILEDASHVLYLMYYGSLVNGALPVGNHPVSSIEQNGNIIYSIGGDDSYDYGSFMATNFTAEGQYSAAYYIIAGNVSVEANNNITAQLVSVNGSDIIASYRGTQDIESISVEEGATKLLRDGQILILRGEKVYTVTGQDVK